MSNQDQSETQCNHSQYLANHHRQDAHGEPSGRRTLESYKRVTYLQMDAQPELKLSQVNGKLCSHIILTSARLDSFGNVILMRKENAAFLGELPKFKSKFPHVKLLISIVNELEHNGLPKAAMSPENRQRFARSAMEFLQRHSLDGVDIDWRFFNFPPLHFMYRDQERIGLTKICSALRSAIVENFFDRQVTEQHHQLQSGSHSISSNITSSVEPYLLSVTIAGQESVLRSGYELKQLCNLCDWLNVMSFDYFLFKPYAPFTGPNSPLYSIVDSFVPILNKFSFAWTLKRLLIDEKVPNDKIVMGIPTYGRAYKLVFKNSQPTAFTLAIGSKPGERNEQHLNYREICDLLAKPSTIVEFDQKARVPYLLTDNGYTWITYENTDSVRNKVQHIVENDLAGYMVWSLNNDDFTGGPSKNCADEMTNHNSRITSESVSFPLHQAMLDELRQLLGD